MSFDYQIYSLKRIATPDTEGLFPPNARPIVYTPIVKIEVQNMFYAFLRECTGTRRSLEKK